MIFYVINSKVVQDLGVYISIYLKNWKLSEHREYLTCFMKIKLMTNIKNELNKKQQICILNDVMLASSLDGQERIFKSLKHRDGRKLKLAGAKISGWECVAI